MTTTHDFTLPSLGEGIVEATIVHWLKSSGDQIAEGEPLLEVATDKVDTEIVAPVGGTLSQIVAAVDEVIAVGQVLAHIDVGDTSPAPGPVHETTVHEPVSSPAAGAPETHPGGTALVEGDDEFAVSPLRGTEQKVSRLRHTIATRMMESLHGSAQLTTVVEVDMTRLARHRDEIKEGFRAAHGVSLTFLPYVARAALDVLRSQPQVNARIDDDLTTITYPDAENLGIAVDTERGLIVPVISSAGSLGIAELALRIADIAARTRENRVSVDELSGGTFTITNTGSRGALFDTPILNRPQSAILGVGAVVERPVVVRAAGGDKAIAIRAMAYLALSYDHRVVDGADAARFLGSIKSWLESDRIFVEP